MSLMKTPSLGKLIQPRLKEKNEGYLFIIIKFSNVFKYFFKYINTNYTVDLLLIKH